MSQSDFQTITELKLQVRVLVFSVFNVSELISRLMRVKLSRNLKKQWMYMQDVFLKTPLLIYFNFFPKFSVFQNLSCQTRGAAYLREFIYRNILQNKEINVKKIIRCNNNTCNLQLYSADLYIDIFSCTYFTILSE